jgi:mannose-1-phosphate guanylyltransferase
MKAMILAAGMGTRLLPLTEKRPKALMEIEGRTLLQITVERLRACGVDQAIVNVHHFADMIVAHLEAHEHFGMRLEVSREKTLLDTGGGLKKAAWFFLEEADEVDSPFVLHNVDVISGIDIPRMVEFHRRHEALATLAVQNRNCSSYLLFDSAGQLCGWRSEAQGRTRLARPAEKTEALSFTGIHVISPHFLRKLTEVGVFSIIESYLHLAGRGERIAAFRADEYPWQDVGSLETLEAARRHPLS